MAGDPRWRSVATYALATGIALVVLFMANGFFARPDDARYTRGQACSE